MLDDKHNDIIVHIKPNAGRNSVKGFKEGVLHLGIAAPPVNNRANSEMVKFLSKILGVSKSCVDIKRGLTSSRKVIHVSGMSLEQVYRRLNKPESEHGND